MRRAPSGEYVARRARVAAIAVCVLLCALGAAAAPAGAAELRSKLPIVAIKTSRAIPNEPKVAARVRVIHQPARRANRASDGGNAYTRRPGTETRGHSS
jgi:hypothetical protein